MRPVAALLAEFSEAFGFGGKFDPELRIRLHNEENQELVAALKGNDLADIAQELADVVYVAYGTADALGIPLDKVIAEVHEANMSKLGPDGNAVYSEFGKLLKGPHYRKPDVAKVLGTRKVTQ